MRLTSVSDLLAPLLASLGAARVRSLAPRAAIGARLASSVLAPRDKPARAVALRSGLAVSSLDVAGASGHAPVPLPARPVAVSAGQELPAACDAVIDAAAVEAQGPVVLCMESVEPGAHTRLPGQDVRAGTALALPGALMTPELALACELAGVEAVDVVRPSVHVDMPAGAERDWLLARLVALGCVEDAATANLVLRPPGPSAERRLALRPGDTAWAQARDGRVLIEIPARFDEAVAAFVALALPVVAAMTGASVARRLATLARKLSSRIGYAELALLRLDGDEAEPLGVGDLTLAHLARADAFALLPPDSEGHAAGERIAVTRFDAMLTGAAP